MTTKRMKSFLLTVIGVLTFFGGRSQVLDPVKWTYEAEKVTTNQYDLHFRAKVDKGWHIYSQFLPEADIRPVPTTFNFEKNNAVKFEGKVKENGKKEDVYDPNFEMQLTYFSNQVTFTQRVTLLKPVTKIAGTLEFMVCDDEKCLPPDEREFSFNVKYEKAGEQVVPDKKNEPVKEPEQKEEGSNTNPFTPSDEAKTNSRSGIKKPVKWNYEVKKISDDVYELRFTAKIDEGWHIYAVDGPRTGGPTPTTVSFEPGAGVEPMGALQPTEKPKMKSDSIFGDVLTHEGTITFTQQVKLSDNTATVKGNLDYMSCNDQCVKLDEDFEVKVPKRENAQISNRLPTGLYDIFGQGLFFGFIALITPCVFPMIPLTVSFFLKKSGSRLKGVLTAITYGLSIIVIYVGLAYLISVIFGSDALNDMATNIYFNLAFFAIFIVFAISFFGAFEITLPSSWANKADAKSDQGGIIGIFFMALTLAIVSFSCTGLFVGDLIVLSAQRAGFIGPVIGMLGFSVGLALPFTIFATFPSLMQSLPKSGGWLNSVKVTMGFIELALALKFLSIVDMAYHWDMLKREYFLVIWIVIFALLGFYLLGKLRFKHDSELQHISISRLLFAILSFSFAAYMVPGLFGAPLKLLSGLAPPLHYSEWTGITTGSGGTSEGHEATTTTEKIYDDLFHCPHGLDCYFDYDEGLAKAKETGKPLMLDFTGWGCTNCRDMEENVWSRPEILARLRNDVVLVSLYVDDKTSLPEKEKFYSEALQKKVKTIGKKWMHLQVSRFNSNSQPYYVMLDHNGQTLGEPAGHDKDAQKFVNFLDNGKAEFQKRMNSTTASK